MRIITRRVLWKSTWLLPQLPEVADCFPMLSKLSDASLFALCGFTVLRSECDLLAVAVRVEIARRAAKAIRAEQEATF